MRKLAFMCGILPLLLSFYVGCGGDTEESAIVEVDSGLEEDAGHPDLRVMRDASGGTDADATPDALEDVVDAADVYACTIMNLDERATFGDASCNQCMSQNCCDDVTACFSVEDCVQRAQCLRACDGGVPCRNACTAAHPDSGTSLAALSLCLSGQCESDGCETFP
jgi:hypothetical protein